MKAGINLLMGFSLIVISCSEVKNKYTVQEFNQYLQTENCVFSGKQRAGKAIYDIKYRPSALISALEHEVDSIATSRRQELDKMYWFNIVISVDGSSQSPLRHEIADIGEYNERLDYYLNRAAADIWIEHGKDKISPASYWFENNHNLTPYETIVVGFDRAMFKGDDVTLCFNDRALRSGIIKNNFSTKNLNKKIVITYR